MGNYKYGLHEVTAQPTVSLCSYYTSDLPSVDSLKYPLGQPDLVQPHMFLNQLLGCCGIAGRQEEIRVANALRGVTVTFTDKTTVANYSQFGYEQGPEIEGFNADGSAIINPDAEQNPSDGGVDMHTLFDFCQSTGFVDADGQEHKIVGYAGLTPGDWDEMLIALSLFQIVGIGIRVPDYAEAQFEAGQPWHLERGRHRIVGGHYIPIVGAPNATEGQLFTWGALGGIEQTFYASTDMTAVVALTAEMFDGAHPAVGAIDFDALSKDLPAFNTGPVSAKAPRGRRKSGAKVSVDGVDQGEPGLGDRPDDADTGEQIA